MKLINHNVGTIITTRQTLVHTSLEYRYRLVLKCGSGWSIPNVAAELTISVAVL